jgi:putative acetyltransferase
VVRATLKTRPEIPADSPAIRTIHLLAFDTCREADLVDKLRNNAAVKLSIVAEEDGAIVGHVAFSPVELGSGVDRIQGLGLGPIAVLPHLQKHGIGTQLIQKSIGILKTDGCPFVVVLGPPGFYARFGFQPARDFGIRCKWDAQADSFLLLALDAAAVARGAGLAQYGAEFDVFGPET